MAIELLITTAGLDALVNAQAGATESIRVVEVGLTASAFTIAPTIDGLPGEFKRIDAVSGQAVSESVIHMTVVDSSVDVYDLRGIGLYLDDGTLFAVYSQTTPIFRKVSIASFLLALDVAFGDGAAVDIIFGDATFLLPPATEAMKGVAEIATSAEVAAGSDDERIVTSRKLKQRLDALASLIGTDMSGLEAALASLLARTISGSGLVTGGGTLSASHVLQVTAASAGDVLVGSATDRAITPAALSGLPRSLGAIGQCMVPGTDGFKFQWGAAILPAGASSATFSFPFAFDVACFRIFISAEQNINEGDEADEPSWAYPISSTQGLIECTGDHSETRFAFFALGK